MGQQLLGSNPCQTPPLHKDNDQAGLARKAAGAVANDTAIKPLECAAASLASIPKRHAQFGGQMVRLCGRMVCLGVSIYQVIASFPQKYGIKKDYFEG